jgi:hypothetical protein
MASTLARALKTDMNERLPLRKAAEKLRKKGRGNDTILAHITPREAAKLKREGGSGTINPDTGLPEFDDGFSMDFNLPTDIGGAVQSGIDAAAAPPTVNVGPSSGNVPAAQFVDNAPIGYSAGTETQGPNWPFGGGMNFNYATSSAGPGYSMGTEVQGPPMPASGDLVMNVANAGPQSAESVLNSRINGDINQTGAGTGTPGQPMQLPGATPSQQPGSFLSNLGAKDLIAGLGVGATGLSYLLAQNQAKKNAAALQAAYSNAAQQTQNLAQPYLQQGGTQLAQALTGQLSPAQLQQLQAAQAQGAQLSAHAGGVGAAQTERSIEDLRQRLLSQQQQLALSLLGAGTPLASQAIQEQLQGTTAGIQVGQQLSAQAGQAATGVMQMLASLYGRSGTTPTTTAGA